MYILDVYTLSIVQVFLTKRTRKPTNQNEQQQPTELKHSGLLYNCGRARAAWPSERATGSDRWFVQHVFEILCIHPSCYSPE
jgi:hypothetical protein